MKKPWFVAMLGMMAVSILYMNGIAPLMGGGRTKVIRNYENTESLEEDVDDEVEPIQKRVDKKNRDDSLLILWFAAADSMSDFKDPFKSLDVSLLEKKEKPIFMKKEKKNTKVRGVKKARITKKAVVKKQQLKWQGIVNGPEGRYLLKEGKAYSKGDSLLGGRIEEINTHSIYIKKNGRIRMLPFKEGGV